MSLFYRFKSYFHFLCPSIAFIFPLFLIYNLPTGDQIYFIMVFYALSFSLMMLWTVLRLCPVLLFCSYLSITQYSKC